MFRSKGWLLISAALTAIYTGYVVWAKVSAVSGKLSNGLSETAEFLLFLSAVLTFAMQVFVEDAARGDTTDTSE